MEITERNFLTLLSKLRRQRSKTTALGREAVFAIPGRGVVKVSVGCQRYTDWAEQYFDCLVGEYSANVADWQLEEDLAHMGVQVAEVAV